MCTYLYVSPVFSCRVTISALFQNSNLIINNYIISIPSLATAEESVSTVSNGLTGDSWSTAGGVWGWIGGTDATAVPI